MNMRESENMFLRSFNKEAYILLLSICLSVCLSVQSVAEAFNIISYYLHSDKQLIHSYQVHIHDFAYPP